MALALFAIAPACHPDDVLPTGPPRTLLPVPTAAVLGADVTSLGFEVVAINESGQVAGTLNGRAVLWTPNGATVDLGTLGGPSSRAYAINASGQVAGSSVTATGTTHAFLWTPGQGMRDLGTLPGGALSIGRGINDRAEVVGQSTRPRADPLDPRGPVTHAFRWTLALGMEDLGTLGSLNGSIAYDINNVGHVVGRAYAVDRDIFPPIDPEFYSRAFLWMPGQGMQDIGALSGGYSVAHAINDLGTVVGRSWVSRPTSFVYHAFRWRAGEGMQDLGAFALSNDSSVAYGINNANQIVGSSKVGIGDFLTDYTATNAFIWSAAEGLENLTPTTGIGTARAINDRQQVVGDGRVALLQLGPGNVSPVAKAGGPYTGTEGTEVAFDMSATDLDGGQVSGQVRYGDGTSDFFDVMLPYPRPSQPGKHVYADDGTYTLTLIVSDTRGGRDTATATVTIGNVAPTIVTGSLTGPTTAVPLAGGSVNVPITFGFSDPAALNDVYSAEVACGNGVVVTATDLPVSGSTGAGVYTGRCSYTGAGVYVVRATVSDEDGGVSSPVFFRYVVVYDPAGGYTSGNGFYELPRQRKQKVHFSFDARYGAGATEPNGQVTLRIPGGEFDFQSSAIEMLVVSGNRAQFWGSGTLNGAPGRFRITVVIGQGNGKNGSPDAIRVELWNGAGTTLLYDTQPGAAQDAPVTTATGGGNIRIVPSR
jgi:probable HAF family extracellular repeat protein